MTAAAALVARYEVLREGTRAGHLIGSHGWRVLVERGMAAWMVAANDVDDARPCLPTARASEPAAPPRPAPDELTRVLVAMTLSCLQEMAS